MSKKYRTPQAPKIRNFVAKEMAILVDKNNNKVTTMT